MSWVRKDHVVHLVLFVLCFVASPGLLVINDVICFFLPEASLNLSLGSWYIMRQVNDFVDYLTSSAVAVWDGEAHRPQVTMFGAESRR